MNANRNQNEDKDDDIPDSRKRIRWHKVMHQLEGEGVDLVAGTDKNEESQEDIENWIIRDQNQDAMSVSTQPDMILGYEQFYVQFAKPGKEAGVTRSNKS